MCGFIFRVLLPGLILTMGLSGQGMRAPTDGWLFDEGVGTTVHPVAGDATGQFMVGDGTVDNLNATVGNGTTAGPEWWEAASTSANPPTNLPTTLPFNYSGSDAVYFDSYRSYIDFPALAGAQNGQSEVTYQFWVYSTASAVNDGSFFTGSSNAAGQADNYGARHDDRGFEGGGNDVYKFSIGLDDEPAANTYEAETQSYTAVTGQWQHVVMTYDSDVGLTTWVDGQLQSYSFNDTPSGQVIDDQEVFWLGTGAKAYWEGLIDEVAVWDVALTEAEVAKLYNNSLAAFNFWDNGKSGDSTWQTGADENWLGDQNPRPQTDVFFGIDPDLAVDQNVQIVGAQTVRSLNFDAPFAYTLSGDALILEEDTTSGYSTTAEGIAINLTTRNLNAGEPTPDHTIDSAIELRGDVAIFNESAGDLVLTGDITDDGALRDLNKTGSGALVLGGENAFGGDVNIAAGTLEIRNNDALGTAAHPTHVNISAGATLALTNASVNDREAITVTGSGEDEAGAIRNLSGSNTFAGDVTLTGDTTLGSDNGDLTFTGTITDGSDSFALTKVGDGELTLGSPNPYDGGTTIAGGVLALTDSHALGTGSVTVTSGTALELESGGLNVANDVSLAGAGNGAQSALQLSSGASTMTGEITLAADATVGAGSGATLTLTGVIADGADDFNLTKTGAGTVVLSASHTFTGDAIVAAGTLRAGQNNALDDRVVLQIDNGATYDLNGLSDTVANLQGDGTIDLGSARSGTLTYGGNDAATTLGGSITGQGNVVKEGLGTTTLEGENHFAGSFTVTDGALTLENSSGEAISNPNTNLVIENGGTLLLAESNQLNDSVDLVLGGGSGSESARFAVNGVTDSLGTLTLSDDATLDMPNTGGSITFADYDPGSNNVLEITNWTEGSDRIFVTTELAGGPGQAGTGELDRFVWRGIGPGGSDIVGAYQSGSGEILPFQPPPPIPEPRTVAAGVLLALFAGVHGWRRWRKKQAQSDLRAPSAASS